MEYNPSSYQQFLRILEQRRNKIKARGTAGIECSKLTCSLLTTGPSLQPSSKGSEILIFLVHFTSLSKNSAAMLSWK